MTKIWSGILAAIELAGGRIELAGEQESKSAEYDTEDEFGAGEQWFPISDASMTDLPRVGVH